MAAVVSASKTERGGKESNKYVLSVHFRSGAVLNNAYAVVSQSPLSGRERQVNRL